MVMGSFAQTSSLVPPVTNNALNQLSVRLWIPRAGEPLHAPATIHIVARIVTSTPAHKGDVVAVNFFADAQPIGSGMAVWHDGLKPDPHSNRPQPMIVSLPGFSATSVVWSNAPAGSHALTARVAGPGSTPVVSPPIDVVVLP